MVGGEETDGLSGWSSREKRTCVLVVVVVFGLHASHSAFRISQAQVWRATDGLCEDDYDITIFQNQPVPLIREGFLLTPSLLYSTVPTSVGNVGHCMGGDAANSSDMVKVVEN